MQKGRKICHHFLVQIFYIDLSDPVENVKDKAKNIIPEVYDVQYHFYKNNLPKLPNGKYDGVSLVKTIDF